MKSKNYDSENRGMTERREVSKRGLRRFLVDCGKTVCCILTVIALGLPCSTAQATEYGTGNAVSPYTAYQRRPCPPWLAVLCKWLGFPSSDEGRDTVNDHRRSVTSIVQIPRASLTR